MKLARVERISGVVLLAIGAFLLLEVSNPQYRASPLDEGVNPGFFPTVLLIIWVAIALRMVVRPPSAGDETAVHVDWGKVVSFVLPIALYFLAFASLGFEITTLAFLTITPMALGFRPRWLAVVWGVIASTVVWFMFNKVFQLVFPASPFSF